MAAKQRRADPKPPRGFESGEVLAPVAGPEPDLTTDLQREIQMHVDAGFLSPREIPKRVAAAFEDQIATADCRRLIKPMLAAALEDHQRAQRRWRGRTDCERLDAAFAELERRGILARHNYWCCGMCGCAAIDDEMQKLRRKKKRVRGYAFYHEQDVEAAVAGNSMCLSYGSADFEHEASVEVGHTVMKTLRKHGLRVVWNGDLDRRLVVRLKWRRRRPQNA